VLHTLDVFTRRALVQLVRPTVLLFFSNLEEFGLEAYRTPGCGCAL